MNRRMKVVTGVTAGLILAGIAAAGVAAAADSSGDDSADVALTGTDLSRASEAALAETGGGEVVDSEVEGEESGFEVEVNLSDGRQIEVQLDANFAVVSSDVNDEGDDGDADRDSASAATERGGAGVVTGATIVVPVRTQTTRLPDEIIVGESRDENEQDRRCHGGHYRAHPERRGERPDLRQQWRCW